MSCHIIKHANAHQKQTRTKQAHNHISNSCFYGTSILSDHNQTAGSNGVDFHENISSKQVVGIDLRHEGGGQQQNQQMGQLPAYGQQPSSDKQDDAYLCQDALSMEKHVSGVYNMSIFEFRAPQARDVLSHLQKEEQQHGEMLYGYMSRNGMQA